MFILKKRMGTILLICLFFAVLSMTACGELSGNDAETTVPTDAETTVATETDSLPLTTEAATEAVTAPPLCPEEPEVAEALTISPVYHVEPHNVSNEVTVTLADETSFAVNFDSTFYGTESAIDRDGYHFGFLYRFERQRYSCPTTPFAVGDLTGDRMGEFFTFEAGKLTVLQKDGSSLKAIYTQKLGFEGKICGVGLFDNDLLNDVLLCRDLDGHLIWGMGTEGGFTWFDLGTLPEKSTLAEGEQLFVGDYDADGTAELILISDITVTTYQYADGVITRENQITLPYAQSGQFLMYAVADINSDGAADIVCVLKDKIDDEGKQLYAYRTYFSRRDGHFGPYDFDGDNKNLYVTYVNVEGYVPKFLTGGDITGDGVDDLAVVATSATGKTTSLYAAVYPSEAPAYDYSSHVIKTEDGYILYTGGLYIDYNTDKYPQTDADHIMVYTSKDGLTWHRNLDSTCFYLGGELGMTGYQTGDAFTEKWWYGNTMEPEVIYVNGVYYMYYQVENYTLDKDGVLMGADRIGVATSTDGIHFERKTDSPALITSDIYSCFTHQEVIYVPDDPDGKPFWMYVRYVHNNRDTKRILIKSADPLRFNMDDGYVETPGLWQIGNQIGYVNNYDGQGNRLFVRITFAEHQDGEHYHTVPTLQFSLDGISWVGTDIRMAGTDMTIPEERVRNNVYFLGMSTINGTGELFVNENGEIEFFYVACTSTSPISPEIFQSSEGVGKMTFTITAEN